MSAHVSYTENNDRYAVRCVC